jgi:uncharacterized protein YeeX (DUF496 family)
MQTIKQILCSAALLLLPFSLAAGPDKDSLRFEVLMNSQMLKTANLQPEFIRSIEITPERHVLLSTKNQFYLLGWGGITPLGKPASSGSIRSFAFSPDSLLMVVKDDEICYFDSNKELKKLYKLPGKQMAISAGKDAMYVYGQSYDASTNVVYVITPGGKYAILFEVSLPVNAVEELDSSLIFASGNMVYRFDLKTKNYKVLSSLAKEKKIISVTSDPSCNRVYFSTDSAIYTVNDTSAITVSEGIGGILKFFDDGLVVFDPAKKFLLRIAGIEQELANAQPYKPEEVQKEQDGVLRNSNIIALAKSEMSDALIISIIRRSKADFNLSIDSMIDLSAEGVSSEVIMEMRKAMKRQASEQKN